MESARVKIPFFQGGLRRILSVGGLLIAACLLLGDSLVDFVPPNEMAVRQVLFGPGQGFSPDIVGQGYHLVLPGYTRLHHFPRSLEILEFNVSHSENAASASQAPAINIQTSEGYRVTVDVTIAYRVVDPVKVIMEIGLGDAYIEQVVRPRAEQVLRQTLGVLDAEQFYRGRKRREAAIEARDLLDRDLHDRYGVQIWAVLVRHYVYDPRYQEAIENRKIQDQRVFLNRAEAVKAAEQAERDRVEAEGTALVNVEETRGAAEVTRIAATADLYSRKRIAEGDLLVELARAESKRLENDALSGVGASNIVGLKMAEALEGTEVIVLPSDGPSGSNPLDLGGLIRGW